MRGIFCTPRPEVEEMARNGGEETNGDPNRRTEMAQGLRNTFGFWISLEKVELR